MASPRISWDVHVPDLLQNGSLLTRWEEVLSIEHVLNSLKTLHDEEVNYTVMCGKPL